MATLRDLAQPGYGLGGGNVERAYSGMDDAFPVDQGGQVVDQLPPYNPVMDPTKGGATPPAAPIAPGGWQMPGMAFAPGASQNAPRLFQDPTTGAWTLSEHGNFRGVPTDQVSNAQGYVSSFWSDPNIQNGFIQPGHTNYDPTQAMSNEQYGQPSNWQSLWTNAGLTPPTQSATPTPLIGSAQPSNPMGGTLAELSNPERVNQLSASSYGDFSNPSLVR